MLWYQKGDISDLLKIPPQSIVCFDTETTGFDAQGNDEILQLSIIDGTGKVLFSDYVKPSHRQRWPKAQEVNGISPAMVKDKRTMEEIAPEIDAAFAGAKLLVAYNLEFDASFLIAAGVNLPDCEEFDVMKEFAPVAGKWNSRRGDFSWVKLGSCARHYGYRFAAHDALEDTRATLHCFFAMLADDKEGGYQSIVRIWAESNEKRRAQEAERKAEELRRAAEMKAEEEKRARIKREQEALQAAKLAELQKKARLNDAIASGEAKYVSKPVYVLLAVLFGDFGIHDFYAGKTARAVVELLFCWTFIPWVVAIVQAVMMLRAPAEDNGKVLVWKKKQGR